MDPSDQPGDGDPCDVCGCEPADDYREHGGRAVYLCWGCWVEALELARRAGEW